MDEVIEVYSSDVIESLLQTISFATGDIVNILTLLLFSTGMIAGLICGSILWRTINGS